MSIVNPVDQITSSMGMLRPITWADVLEEDDEEVNQMQRSGVEVALKSDAHNGLDVGVEHRAEEERQSSRAADAELTARNVVPEDLARADPDALPGKIAPVVIKSDAEKERSATPPSSSSSSSLSSSLSSSSSREPLPAHLEPKQRHCIGPGVFTLCDTLKQVRVGNVERPTIYYHAKDENGSYIENTIPVQAIGDEPAVSSPSSTSKNAILRGKTKARYTSPMVAALDNRPFHPRGSSRDGRPSWHDPSTYRAIDTSPRQQHQPNYAPFYSKHKRMEQQMQMQSQRQMRHHMPMSNTFGPTHMPSHGPRPDYGHMQPQPQSQWYGVRQGQYQQRPPPYQTHQPFEGRRLPPRASLHGLLPPQGYDMQHAQSNNEMHRYDGTNRGHYDPAPHQGHWRDPHPYERAEMPLQWASPATGANAIPCRGSDRYADPSDEGGYGPDSEVWREDVDFVKKGILHRTRS